ncbi:MAG: hypothetical protein K6C36_09445 [Clostridia bacterium]|nr:hypothetical protein [Clostridia bacterium]
MRSRSKIRNVIKGVAALLALAAVFFGFNSLSAAYSFNPQYAENQSRIAAFEKQEKDSVDVVLFGTSAMRAWLSPWAYKWYGIRAFGLQTDAQPFAAAQALLEGAVLRNQSPVLAVIDLTASVKYISSVEGLHLRYIVEGLDFADRITFLQRVYPAYKSAEKVGNVDVFSYLFPFLYEHNHYQNFSTGKDYYEAYLNTFKGTFRAPYTDTSELAKPDVSSFSPEEPDPESLAVLDDLLDFCDGHPEMQFLFILTPKGGERKEFDGGFGDYETEMSHDLWVMEHVRERGYTVLDFNTDELLEAVGIDFGADFKDNRHLNIYGTLKFTNWLSEYIVENYELPDRSADETESWDKAYIGYMQILSEKRIAYENYVPQADKKE